MFIASVAIGQQSDAAFWQTPGNTVRDASGNITYTQIKDSKKFTMKIFDRGQWVTYYYEPNSTKVAMVEEHDTSEDYLYDCDNWNGLTVHEHGRSHTIHATDTYVVADDMPAITIERDARNRDIAVKRGIDVVETVSYDAGGQVRRLTIGTMTIDLSIQSDGIHQVLTANGAILITTVAKGNGKLQFPISLDPFADRLGLASDWRNTLRVKVSATGSLLSVSDALSRPVSEMVQLGSMFAAFDAKGAPLFYDIRLSYAALLERGDSDTGPDPTTEMNGVLPDRLIVPVTGNASAYVSSPRDGAISSLWTSAGSATSYRFVVYHE
jgi:hypothetical protein